MQTVQRAYKYRFYPDQEQKMILGRTFGCARFVYNPFLRVRTDAFFNEGKRVGFNDTCLLLTELKQQPETIWLAECSSVPWPRSRPSSAVPGLDTPALATHRRIFGDACLWRELRDRDRLRR